MNRFVYVVHLEYRAETVQLPARVVRNGSRPRWDRAARLLGDLRPYLPDPHLEIWSEQIRHDPQVVRVTVATSLDEEAADAAFVRFIMDRNAAIVRDRSRPS